MSGIKIFAKGKTLLVNVLPATKEDFDQQKKKRGRILHFLVRAFISMFQIGWDIKKDNNADLDMFCHIIVPHRGSKVKVLHAIHTISGKLEGGAGAVQCAWRRTKITLDARF